MNRPTVAAVLAYHRNGEWFREALDSVLAQSHPPDEVIAVDDASPDGGLEALGPFPDGVRILRHDVNTGIGGTRQTGVDHATSDLVAFLDGDDCWAPTKLERQLDFLAEHPEVDVVHSGTVVFHRDGSEVAHLKRPPVLELAEQLRWNHVLMQTTMLPRRWVARVGGFAVTKRYVPDWDFAIRLVEAGATVAAINEPLTRVRRFQHGNISQSGFRQLRRRVATVRRHWPLARATLGRAGAWDAVAGIIAEEGAKSGRPWSWGWRGVAGVLRGTLARGGVRG